MKKLASDISSALFAMGKHDDETAKIARRTAEVRRMWAAVVEDVFLQHTNSVSIVREEGYNRLIVYVDDSMISAELNARRELIKLQFNQRYNENIEEFDIHISYGSHKKTHPYKKEPLPSYREPAPIVPLSSEERSEVEHCVEEIDNPRLRESLKKAMITDLQWKKGLNEKKDG